MDVSQAESDDRGLYLQATFSAKDKDIEMMHCIL